MFDATTWRRIAFVTLCAVTGFLLLIKGVGGHEAPRGWSYDPECCSDRDCSPYPAKNIKQVPGGYEVDGAYFVENAKVKQSRDEEYHLCRLPGGKHIFCLYAPPNGS